jgi:MtN3 and saliva related transmembrane protein
MAAPVMAVLVNAVQITAVQINATPYTWIGFAAGTLTTICFVPQVLQVWRTKRADDLHMGTLVSFTIGIVLWLTYGLLTQQWPVILSNAVTLALQCAILYLKLRYARANKVRAVP